MVRLVRTRNVAELLRQIMTDDLNRKPSSGIGGFFKGILPKWMFGLTPTPVSTPVVRKYYFYEWSDVKRKPLEFSSASDLKKYMCDCKITVLPWHEDLFGAMNECHVICSPGRGDIVIRNSYERLVEVANMWKNIPK